MDAGRTWGMAQTLGRRWIDALDTQRYTVAIQALTGGSLPMLAGVEAIRLVASTLEPRLREAGHVARLGKIVSGSGGSEAGLFFDRGFAEGAVISLSCPPLATEVTILVGRSSPLLRGFVWGALLIGCAIGLLVTHALLPASWDTRLVFPIGLLLGAAIAVAALVLAVRVPFLAGAGSRDLADALDAVVVGWIHGGDRPKRKKRKKEPAPPTRPRRSSESLCQRDPHGTEPESATEPESETASPNPRPSPRPRPSPNP